MTPLARSYEIVLGLCLIVGQSLQIAATLNWPGDGSIGAFGGLLTHWALSLWIGGVIALAAISYSRAPRLALAAAILGCLGAARRHEFRCHRNL